MSDAVILNKEIEICRDSIMEATILHVHTPLLCFKIPEIILKEVDGWVNDSRNTKENPLGFLKGHENYGFLNNPEGKKYNSYQCGVPDHLIQDSYWLAWTLRLCAKYFGPKDENHHREFRIRGCYGHFDGFDLWTNFSYKGDKNPTHNHSGSISGVIYYKNHGHPTIFDDLGGSYDGMDGTMLLFPSSTLHHVEEQIVDEERITFAFNIFNIKNL